MTADENSALLSVGIVQWQVRPFADWHDFSEAIDVQIRMLAGSDFIVFPEYMTLPLLSLAPEGDEVAQLRWLGRRFDTIAERFRLLAKQYDTNIVLGSTPETDGDHLYNTALFCHRDGRMDRYRKIHLVPYETDVWQMEGGELPGLIQTDRGYIGLCVCYDTEFPEIVRFYARAGARLIFVPYNTSTEYGHHRVRSCARARAVENQCYVVAVGSVGNMPEIPHLGFQYAQSGIFTPSDYGFPVGGIAAEAPACVPAAFRVQLDMAQLDRQDRHGTVRTVRDRRTDLYRLRWMFNKDGDELSRAASPAAEPQPAEAGGTQAHSG